MSGADLLLKSAFEIAGAVNSGEVTAVEVTEASLQRISALNGPLNAFTDVTAERALAEARAVDARRAAGERLPLAGVPYSVKNLFDVEGLTTLAGSKINRDNAPASADATLVARMKAAGAILTGAVNMGEYAYDFTGENAHEGPSRNPYQPEHMSGGSSGGSGTSVASGMVALSLGSDTNGSIRVPSSFCGLYGLKPTYGRLSRHGSFPFVAAFDHLGPIGRSPRDLALSFDAMQGPDAADFHLASEPFLETAAGIAKGIAGLRIAIAGGYFRSRQSPQATAAVNHVAAALGVSEEVEIAGAAEARAAAYVITTTEGSSLHLDRLKSRAEDFDPDTRDRFFSGAMVPAPWVVKAQKYRMRFRAQMAGLFEKYDVLLAPATPVQAPKIGAKTLTLDGVEMPARPNIGLFTQPFSFIGLPVVAVPVWLPGAGLPIGVQVVARPFREDVALHVAHELEQSGAALCKVAAIG